jgi:hypothetical protein
MKTIVSLIIFTVLLFVSLSIAQEIKPNTGTSSTQTVNKNTSTWKSYGDVITLKKTTSLAEVLKNQKQFEKKEVLVEGTISEVCENKGCWMVVDAGDKHVRVEFKDYGFFVPWGSEKKKIKMQGMIETKIVSAKAAEHMAGEMKNPPVDKDKLNTDQTITVFTASAIAIKGGGQISTEQQAAIDGKKQIEGHEHEDHDH